MGPVTEVRALDVREGRPLAIAEPMQRVLGRLDANQRFLETFRCGWRKGVQPCQGHAVTGEPLLGPAAGVPFGWVACPIRTVEQCPPQQAWDAGETERARQRWHQEAKRVGIQKVHRDCSFTRCPIWLGQPVAAVEAARRFLAGGAAAGRALLLMGPPGRRKTCASAGTLRAWPGTDKRLLYDGRIASDLLDPDARRRMQRVIERTEFLVWDDFATAHSTAFLVTKWDDLLYVREGEQLPTIFTTNLQPCTPRCPAGECRDPRHLRTRVSPRTYDRLRVWADTELLPGPSLRVPATEGRA